MVPTHGGVTARIAALNGRRRSRRELLLGTRRRGADRGRLLLRVLDLDLLRTRLLLLGLWFGQRQRHLGRSLDLLDRVGDLGLGLRWGLGFLHGVWRFRTGRKI